MASRSAGLWQYTHISTTTETDIAYANGDPATHLLAIVVNTTAAGTVTIADALSGATPVIGVLKASVAEGTYRYDCDLKTGLAITTAGSSDLTIVWR